VSRIGPRNSAIDAELGGGGDVDNELETRAAQLVPDQS
jgi:hypothetical protein